MFLVREGPLGTLETVFRPIPKLRDSGFRMRKRIASSSGDPGMQAYARKHRGEASGRQKDIMIWRRNGSLSPEKC